MVGSRPSFYSLSMIVLILVLAALGLRAGVTPGIEAGAAAVAPSSDDRVAVAGTR